MSALPGGAADKLGNRYEDWWTLYRLGDVLRGRATHIRLEPPGEAGAGVEFWVDEPGQRWYEQVKNAQGNWTLRRLINQSVLGSLTGHLAAGHPVRLVLSTAAPDLAALSSRARAASSVDEYIPILAKEQEAGFRKVSSCWQVDEATAWDYLRRVHVEQQPADHLRRLVHQIYEMLVQGDPEVVVNELRGWLDEMLHQVIAAPMIWDHLKAKGFARRLLVGDPTTLDVLAATVERHHRRIMNARPKIGVAQPHASRLIERLSAADGRQVVVLHGRAGGGKSTVASDALRALTSTGWFAAVVRMDTAAAVSQTAAALGQAFHLAASPAVLLAGVANGSSAVLLVDQLDAVSTYSGRMPDSYDAVSEMLDQVASLQNVKVVLVVRTVDLQTDPRMRSLLSDEDRVDTLEVGDLDINDVRTALTESGVDLTVMSPITLELLRVPLHLTVFSGLSAVAQRVSYRALTDLYETFTDEVRREIARQVGHLDWAVITGTLVRYMSEHERLDAPSAILNEADPREVAALVSRGVLVTDAGRYALFHETYFDFLFARSFLAAGGDLHDFLVESGQHLFRRAQARQVLEHLAAADRVEFRQTVVQLLTSGAVRMHLQDVVITVLEHLDAGPEDWHAVEPLAFGAHKLQPRLVRLLSFSPWFDAADGAGRWEAMLADPTRVDLAAYQLVIAARYRPERVTALVRPHIGTSEAWRLRLRTLVEWSLTPGLVDLAVELIERGYVDDARGPIAVNSDFWSILYGLHSDNPAGAARLIGAYLRRALDRAEAEGSRDPFESRHLSRHSSAGGNSLIGEVAAAAPGDFLEEVLPFVVRVAEATSSGAAPPDLRSSRRWRLRHIGDRHGIDDAVFGGVEAALRLLAQDRPGEAMALVRPLAGSDVEQLLFLACRTLAAAGAGNNGVDWLLSDERNLTLGWTDSPRWASRELIEVATRGCDDAHLHALTERLLNHYPPWERTVYGRRRRGWAQYELLTAVEPSRRPEVVKARIAEWERRFPGCSLNEPRAIEAHFVGPPIPQKAAARMADKDWLGAVDRYRGDETDWSGHLPVGGARKLAQLLGSQAEAQPERFARLALRFGAETPSSYLEQVITAVAGKVPIPLLAELCAHARRIVIAGQGVGKAICRAVETVAADADDTLLRLVIEYAADRDPDHESARTPDGSGQFYYGGELLTAGLNCTRGAAARTIASLLFARPEHADRLMPTVAVLATDPILAVRTQAADAVIALMNTNLQIALDVAAELFDAPVDVFDAVTCGRLLQYAVINEPDRFAPHLRRGLDGPHQVAERAGQVWAVAFVRDLVVEPAPSDLSELCPAARRGAATIFATDPAGSAETLVQLFEDEDPSVREAASSAMRRVGDLDAENAQTLIAAFVASAAYVDHFDDLFFALDGSQRLLPAATVAACERAVDVAGQELGDIRTARSVISNKIIDVILRLYRQADGPMRVRCLDLIDKLTVSGAYGLGEALARER